MNDDTNGDSQDTMGKQSTPPWSGALLESLLRREALGAASRTMAMWYIDLLEEIEQDLSGQKQALEELDISGDTDSAERAAMLIFARLRKNFDSQEV